MSTLSNRYEILFLYECTDCNPNGDPLDENRPRTDAESGEATVTDVRIKRTIRDHLLGLEPNLDKRMEAGLEILIRDTLKADGHLAEGKDRAEQFLGEAAKGKKGEAKRQALEAAVLRHCIDARVFGAALPLGKGEPSLQLTGPVQFSAFNRSLHRVAPVLVQQTAAFAGGPSANQKSFAERWLLPYALIAVNGVANESAARTTGMTESDLRHLLSALWHGTAGLNTHSKIGHDPLLLALFEYQPGYRLGALQNRLSLDDKRVADTALRSTADYSLNCTDLVEALRGYSALKQVRVSQDLRLRCKAGDRFGALTTLLEQVAIPVQALEP